jgi:hypothetical protein
MRHKHKVMPFPRKRESGIESENKVSGFPIRSGMEFLDINGEVKKEGLCPSFKTSSPSPCQGEGDTGDRVIVLLYIIGNQEK